MASAPTISAGQQSPRDPRINPEVSGGPSGGGGGVATGGEEEESVVEKRLKQNREAARRSRDRKRRLKDDLRNRLPVLQEEHDSLTDQVDELMKHLWVCLLPHFHCFRICTTLYPPVWTPSNDLLGLLDTKIETVRPTSLH